jgi:hypothetical protein
VKVYVVPAARPDMVLVAVVPVYVVPPGVCVMVQVPEPVGRPVSTTLPVGVAQSGCVIVPKTGGAIVLTEIPSGVALLDPQLVVPVTVRLPDVAPAVKVIVMAFPVPVIVAPDPE